MRPERFELPTSGFEARHSVQLNYGRVADRAGIEPASAVLETAILPLNYQP